MYLGTCDIRNINVAKLLTVGSLPAVVGCGIRSMALTSDCAAITSYSAAIIAGGLVRLAMAHVQCTGTAVWLLRDE